MKILQVCAYDLSRSGGVQRHVLALTEALRKNGHEVRVIAPDVSFLTGEKNLKTTKKRIVSLAGTRFEISYIPRDALQKIVTDLQNWCPDVVHYHAIWVPFLPWQIFSISKAASIVTFHDTTAPGIVGGIMRGFFRIASAYLSRRIDVAIAVSPTPLAHLNLKSVVILPPAVDLAPFRNFVQHESRPLTVLFWGRLEPRKGVSVLLDAIQKIVARQANGPPLRFVIAGSGDGAEAVLKLQAQLGRTTLHYVPQPTDTELHDLLAAASLVVAPALYGESFGIMVVEAMASGLPVIAANNAGYREVLQGEGAQLLVPTGDSKALAEKILAVMADANLRKRLGIWGAEQSKQFDVTNMLPHFEVQYEKAMLNYARSKLEG